MTHVPFTKAIELMRLADMAAVRTEGVSRQDIEASFGVNHRSAQSMAHALKTVFTTVSVRLDENRRKW